MELDEAYGHKAKTSKKKGKGHLPSKPAKRGSTHDAMVEALLKRHREQARKKEAGALGRALGYKDVGQHRAVGALIGSGGGAGAGWFAGRQYGKASAKEVGSKLWDKKLKMLAKQQGIPASKLDKAKLEELKKRDMKMTGKVGKGVVGPIGASVGGAAGAALGAAIGGARAAKHNKSLRRKHLALAVGGAAAGGAVAGKKYKDKKNADKARKLLGIDESQLKELKEYK